MYERTEEGIFDFSGIKVKDSSQGRGKWGSVFHQVECPPSDWHVWSSVPLDGQL